MPGPIFAISMSESHRRSELILQILACGMPLMPMPPFASVDRRCKHAVAHLVDQLVDLALR